MKIIDKFKNSFQSRKQLIFLVALAFLLPAILFLNTSYNIQALKKIVLKLMISKTFSLEKVIEITCWDNLNNLELLQEKISQIAQGNSEINKVAVLVPVSKNNFKIIASSDKSEINQLRPDLLYRLSWDSNKLMRYGSNRQSNQQIVSPIHNQDGSKIGLVRLNLSVDQINQAVDQSVKYSYFLLLISIVLILLLFGTHNKLYQQAVLAQKLKEIDKMKDEFISMASHELRTPITVIKDYLEEIINGSFGQISEEIKKPLGAVVSSANRLSELIEDLLNVSRIEQGRIKLNLKPVKILPLVQGIVDQMKIHAEKKGLKLIYQPQNEEIVKMPLILADEDRLKQILINLVGNAIKYTFQGQVVVSVKYIIQDKMVEIKVADTGIGMSAKDQERLFEKFYRIRNRKTADVPGTGLGLWITKQLVEMMSGKILVSSIEGRGSEFSLYFPPTSQEKQA